MSDEELKKRLTELWVAVWIAIILSFSGNIATLYALAVIVKRLSAL